MNMQKTETVTAAVLKSYAHKATKPRKRRALCPLSTHLQKDSLITRTKIQQTVLQPTLNL